jgi:hypothetical protein
VSCSELPAPEMQTTRVDLLAEVASARAAARASTLVSVASLLVAAFALAINLYPTPARGLPAAPTEKYLDASRHYVTLAELAVYQARRAAPLLDGRGRLTRMPLLPRRTKSRTAQSARGNWRPRR